MVTASHNPADYNGLKIVREDAKPVSEDTGLAAIKKLAKANAGVGCESCHGPGGAYVKEGLMDESYSGTEAEQEGLLAPAAPLPPENASSRGKVVASALVVAVLAGVGLW